MNDDVGPEVFDRRLDVRLRGKVEVRATHHVDLAIAAPLEFPHDVAAQEPRSARHEEARVVGRRNGPHGYTPAECIFKDRNLHL